MKREAVEKLGMVSLAAVLAGFAIPAATIVENGGGSSTAIAATTDANNTVASGVFGENENAQWRLDNSGCLHVTGSGATSELLGMQEYNTPITSISIGKEITSIGDETFLYFAQVKKVTFEEGSNCSVIGDCAFYGCSKLKRIKIPSTVTTLGKGAFEGCFRMRSVSFGGDNSKLTDIGGSAFDACEKLTSITLPKGLKRIGAYAFTSCFALKSISIPASVKRIEQGAFEDCEKLKNVTFAPGCKAQIASNAFENTKKENAEKRNTTKKTKRIAVKSVKTHGKRKLTVTWSKYPGAKKYFVFYGRNSDRHYKYVCHKSAGKKKVTLKKLKTGKRYNIYVAAEKGNITLSVSKAKKSPKVK